MHILIFDIGKTNKKWVVFNLQFEVVLNHSIKIKEIEDDDGNPCENIEALTKWITEEAGALLSNPNLEISHINFSGYGATLVHLGENGKPCCPVYNYLNESKAEDLVLFEKEHGDLMDFAKQTGSPFTGMLNTGFQIFWLKKHKPNIYSNIRKSLHLPQYLSYVLTKKTFTETTSLGSHTGLWDFRTQKLHKWIEKEGLSPLFPPMIESARTFEIELHGKRVQIGVGIHDSSASLVPYLKAVTEPFVLVSTGTWSIVLNPYANGTLSVEEVRKDILLYLQPSAKSVRAARLFLGREYGSKMEEILKNEGSNEAVDRLNLEMARKHYDAILLALGSTKVASIFVDGGFASNEMFLRMLSKMVKPATIYFATKPMGSALGAAVIMDGIDLNVDDFWRIYDVKSIE